MRCYTVGNPSMHYLFILDDVPKQKVKEYTFNLNAAFLFVCLLVF